MIALVLNVADGRLDGGAADELLLDSAAPTASEAGEKSPSGLGPEKIPSKISSPLTFRLMSRISWPKRVHGNLSFQSQRLNYLACA